MANLQEMDFLSDLNGYGSDWSLKATGLVDLKGVEFVALEKHTNQQGELLPPAMAFHLKNGPTKFITISKEQQEEAESRLGEVFTQVRASIFVDSKGETHRRAYLN